MSQVALQVPALPWETTVKSPPPVLEELAGEILDRCRGEGPANCVARGAVRGGGRASVRAALQADRRRRAGAYSGHQTVPRGLGAGGPAAPADVRARPGPARCGCRRGARGGACRARSPPAGGPGNPVRAQRSGWRVPDTPASVVATARGGGPAG